MKVNEVQYQLLAYLDKNTKLAQQNKIEHNGFWNLSGMRSPAVVNPLMRAGYIELGKDAQDNYAAKLTPKGQEAYDSMHAERAQPLSPWTKWAQQALRLMISQKLQDPDKAKALQEVMQSGEEPSEELKAYVEAHGLGS